LETLNRQQLERANELDRINLFLEGGDSAELWVLQPNEVEGKAFADLDIGLPVKELQDAIGVALSPAASSSRRPCTRVRNIL
jgi:hypothetical protein